MEYRILGPLEVLDEGSQLDLGPHKQRSLLALLVLNANRVVSTDRILEELWGDDSEGKENALWVYISRLRAILEPDRAEPTVLITRDHGYTLLAAPDAVDATRFEAAAASGRSAIKADPEAASLLLCEGLSLWRGDALDDFRYDDFAQADIARLEEVRVGALEDRIEADLRSGKARELIPELDRLADLNPLRERPVSLKMLALYRAGRQAEALRTFERFRRTMGEEMGIDPSPELRRLEEQILLHDSRLQPRLSRRIAASVPTEPVANPYQGLQAFHEGDADRFFGRDRLVAEVIRRLAEERRFVTVVGPSGSGKSSLARAGVIPALRKNAVSGSDGWLVAQMVPGSRPFDELEAALLRATFDAPAGLSEQLKGDDGGILRAALRILPDDTSRVLIVIDQFEELFTLVDNEATRARFLAGLTECATEPHGRVTVLVTLRADFYDRPLRYPAFGTLMSDGIVNVVPMALDELEQAAREPAARKGVTLEPALLASLLTDVIGQPGALPLFQYSLAELFDRRVGDTVTIETYQAMGGLRGALTRRADDLLSELTATQQAAARQLFLRLVSITDSDEWSRRRVPASEILALDVDVVDLKAVIDSFGLARLITFDRDHLSGAPTVEVAHEALLSEWERLRAWIDDARDDVRRHAALTAAMEEWLESDMGADYLLSGTRLDRYEEWAGSTTMQLTTGEQAYLEAAMTARDHAIEREQARIAAEERVQRAAGRRLWGLVAAIVGLLAIGIGVLAAVLAPDPPTIALVGVPRDGDPFNLQLITGFDLATAKHGFVDVEFNPTSDPGEEFHELLRTGPDLVIVPTPFLVEDWVGVTFAEVAALYPETLFVAFDSFSEPAPNVLLVSFRSEEGAFLVGAAAALASETKSIGFVGGMPYTVDHFRAGFESGAIAAVDDITVLSRYVLGTPDELFQSPQGTQDAAQALYDRGADIVFTAAGIAGEGTLVAAAAGSSPEMTLWGIGADHEQELFADVRLRDHLLTSMLIRRDWALGLIIDDFLDGNLESGERALGIADGVLTYSDSGGHLNPATIEQVNELRDDIRAGLVEVPYTAAEPPSDPPEPDRVVGITVGEGRCVLSDPPTLTVGDVVRFDVANLGTEATGLAIWVFSEGVSLDDVAGSPWDISRYSSSASAANLDPGGSTSVTLKVFDAGTWGVTCFGMPGIVPFSVGEA